MTRKVGFRHIIPTLSFGHDECFFYLCKVEVHWCAR